MAKEIITPPGVFDSRKKYKYAQAIKAGNIIFLAGQVAWDENGNVVGKGDYDVQLRQIFENIKRTLAAAGAQMSDIVWMLWLHKDIRDSTRSGIGGRYSPVWKEYFGDHEPPGTRIQVAALGQPDLLLEVQVIAIVDK